MGNAVIIAVNKFSDASVAPLPWAVSEAERLERVLTSCQFSVDVMFDGNEFPFLQPDRRLVLAHIKMLQELVISDQDMSAAFFVVILSRGCTSAPGFDECFALFRDSPITSGIVSETVLTLRTLRSCCDRFGRTPNVFVDTWPLYPHAAAFGAIIGQQGVAERCMFSYEHGQGGIQSYYLRRSLSGQLMHPSAFEPRGVQSSEPNGGLSSGAVPPRKPFATVVDFQAFIGLRCERKHLRILEGDYFYEPGSSPLATIAQPITAASTPLAASLDEPLNVQRQGVYPARLSNPAIHQHLGGQERRRSKSPARSPRHHSTPGAHPMKSPRSKSTSVASIATQPTRTVSSEHFDSVNTSLNGKTNIITFEAVDYTEEYFSRLKLAEALSHQGALIRFHLHLRFEWTSTSTLPDTVCSYRWRSRHMRVFQSACNGSKGFTRSMKQMRLCDFEHDHRAVVVDFGDAVTGDHRSAAERTMWALCDSVMRQTSSMPYFTLHAASGYALMRFRRDESRRAALLLLQDSALLEGLPMRVTAVFVPATFTIVGSSRDYRRVQKMVAFQTTGSLRVHYDDVELDPVDERTHQIVTKVQATFRGYRMRRILKKINDIFTLEVERRSLIISASKELYQRVFLKYLGEQQGVVFTMEAMERRHIRADEGHHRAEIIELRLSKVFGEQQMFRHHLEFRERISRLLIKEIPERFLIYVTEQMSFWRIVQLHLLQFQQMWMRHYVLLDEYHELMKIRVQQRRRAVCMISFLPSPATPPCDYNQASQLVMLPASLDAMMRKSLCP